MGEKHFIKGAINPDHKGLLRKELGAKAGHNIPQTKLKAAEAKSGKIGMRARFSEFLKNHRPNK